MRTGTRITRETIHLLADDAGVSAEELYSKMVDAKLAFMKEQNIQWSCGFFGKDETWYDETIQRIEQIKQSLPNDISPNERTVRLYGWIEKNGKKNLSLPMMYDKDLPEYAHAVAVEYALTNPDAYNRAMNWD